LRRYVAVYALDHVGHGQSGGKQHAFPQGFAGVVADSIQFAKLIRSQHPEVGG